MRVKSPRFRTLLPLLLALVAAAPPPEPSALELAPIELTHPLDFRAICPYEARLCADYDRLDDELDGAAGEKLDIGRIRSLNGEFIDLVRGSDAVIFQNAGKLKIEDPANMASIYGGLWVLREKVNKATLDSAPDEAARIMAELSAQEKRADELMAAVNSSLVTDGSKVSAVARLDVLNIDATRTWEEVKTLARNVDRLGPPIESKADGKMAAPGTLVKDTVNPLQERVAGLRDRLAKIKRAAEASGLSRADIAAAAQQAGRRIGSRLSAQGLDRDVFERKDALEVPSIAARPPPLGMDRDPGRGAPHNVALTVSPKMLLDNRPPPAVERPTTPLPPRTVWDRLTGASPLYGGGERHDEDKEGNTYSVVVDAYPKETARIAKLREKGGTATVGDPGGRAKYVFRQMGGTCALASQAQMYAEAHGIKPTRGAMRKIEDEFYAKAHATNQFTGNSSDPKQRWTEGTSDEHLGNMLDTPVKKHYLAKDEDLLKAVSGGKMVMIAANTGLLWNDKRHLSGGHAVVITGAEVDRDGALLGYYINDTATNEAARFVSAKQFIPAWRDRGSIFIEPL